jgi:SAM-dependent methyltransferase
VSWNHNTHYHRLVLEAIPGHCARALDAGCGRGELTRKLAPHCREVVGIDSDLPSLTHAKAFTANPANVTFWHGDIMREPLPSESFDLVVAVATLHHLPLRPALERFRDLLRSKGVLVIVGLYRSATLVDYAASAAALPVSWTVRLVVGERLVGAPIQDPTETLATIRTQCQTLLPGSILRRRFFFRYTAIWRKP